MNVLDQHGEERTHTFFKKGFDVGSRFLVGELQSELLLHLQDALLWVSADGTDARVSHEREQVKNQIRGLSQDVVRLRAVYKSESKIRKKKQ